MIALTTAQIIAIVIFVVVMALIISEKVHRTTAALAAQSPLSCREYSLSTTA